MTESAQRSFGNGSISSRPAVATDTYPSLEGLIDGFCDGIAYIYRAPDLQFLPIPTLRWKDLSMDFVIGLPISTDWKGTSYDSILVIVDRLTKMVHYKPV